MARSGATRGSSGRGPAQRAGRADVGAARTAPQGAGPLGGGGRREQERAVGPGQPAAPRGAQPRRRHRVRSDLPRLRGASGGGRVAGVAARRRRARLPELLPGPARCLVRPGPGGAHPRPGHAPGRDRNGEGAGGEGPPPLVRTGGALRGGELWRAAGAAGGERAVRRPPRRLHRGDGGPTRTAARPRAAGRCSSTRWESFRRDCKSSSSGCSRRTRCSPSARPSRSGSTCGW